MESILVCKRVDEEVGQNASETPEALCPRGSGLLECSPERGKKSLPTWKTGVRVCLASARVSRPAGERRKKGSEQSFTGVPSNTVASYMCNISVHENSLHAVLGI